MKLLIFFTILYFVFRVLYKKNKQQTTVFNDTFFQPQKVLSQRERNKQIQEHLHKDVGNIKPICPYCNCYLPFFPTKKTTCKNPIFIVTRPADSKRVLVTEKDKERLKIDKYNIKNYFWQEDFFEYEKKFFETSSKLMELIPEQNKDELARYVIRRDMLVRLLKLALKNELEKQKQWKERKEKGEKVREEQEGLIHDLIFKRKAKNTLNDLWILNEEFSHFQGLSDLPLNELEMNSKKLLKKDIDIEQAMTSVGLSLGSRLKKRPDIFLYPEEGKCILIEFKAPEVDLTKHLDQISKYAKLIANYSEEKITQFYGFLIGENINQIDVPDRYRKSFYNGYWFYPDEPIASVVDGISVANIYQEIIPLSTIAKRAFIRNKSFSDKLGITIENNNF